jgi:MFS family permease
MNRKPSLLVIFLTVFIDLIGFGIVLPLLPRYADKFGAEGFMIGLIIASFSVMQFFFAPAWGRLSDRIGRRPVLLISTAGAAVSYALFAVAAWPGLSPATALTLLLVSRVFAGICGANISVASAYIADVTTPDKRSRGMGFIGMAFGLGFILGPVIGALSASHLGLQGPGWVAAGICAANFILAFFVLAESRKPGAQPAAQRPKLAQWGHVLKQRHMGFLILLYFVATFSFACFESTLPLFLGSPDFHPDEFRSPASLANQIVAGKDPVSVRVRARLSAGALKTLGNPGLPELAVRRELFFGLNELLKSPDLYAETAWQGIALPEEAKHLIVMPRNVDTQRRLNRLLLEAAYPADLKSKTFFFDVTRIGYLFAFCGLMSAMVQGGMIGRLVKRFGESSLIWGSLIMFGVSLLIIPYAGTLGILLAGLALVSMTSGLNRAPTMGLISIFTPAAEQGGVMGVTQGAGTLARAFGGFLGPSAYALYPNSPFVAGAGLCVIAGIIALKKLPKRAEVPTHEPVLG